MEKTTGLKAGCSRDPRQLLRETCGQGTTEYAILVGVLAKQDHALSDIGTRYLELLSDHIERLRVPVSHA